MVKYFSNDSDTDKEDVKKGCRLTWSTDSKEISQRQRKFKGKLPIMCFNCNEVSHIAARCSEKKNYRGGDKYKSRRDEDRKYYKDKDKKSCYIA